MELQNGSHLTKIKVSAGLYSLKVLGKMVFSFFFSVSNFFFYLLGHGYLQNQMQNIFRSLSDSNFFSASLFNFKGHLWLHWVHLNNPR